MPQRLSQSSNLSMDREVRKSNTQKALCKAAASAIVRTEVGRPMVENLEGRQLLSSTWFVSPSGSNTNPGTLAAPFKTIQQAANSARNGDHVEIETGVYHETVAPHRAGITFEAYSGENVTVSGADPVTGWTNYSGNIYSAPMPWTLGEGNDQVFVNGQYLQEAQFPNTPIGDYSHPGVATIQSVTVHGGSATIYDSALSQPANFWTGALIHLDAGQAWVDETGTVTSSAPGSVSIRFYNQGGGLTPMAGNSFQLIGKFQALDTAGEWYRDPGTGRLYVWAPNGGNPASMDVEAQARKYAFDLSGAAATTIRGIHIFSATIRTTAGSKNDTINGITAQYLGRTLWMSNGYLNTATQGNGIMLMGNGDVLENSNISYSSGDGVYVGSPNVAVLNNVIHDVDSNGGDMAGIRVETPNTIIEHNTVYNAGRDGIQISIPQVQVLYNVVHDVGFQTTEAGGIYTEGTHANGATIAFNDIYNIHTGGWGAGGIFLDNNSAGWNVHNNIVSNADYGMKITYTSHNNNIYNNTLSGNLASIGATTVTSWSGTRIANNILNGPVLITPGAIYTGNTRAFDPNVGAGNFSAGASGVVNTVTSPVITPPVTTPPVTTPPGVTPPVTTPVVSTPKSPVTLGTIGVRAVNYAAAYRVGGDGYGGMGGAYNNSWMAYHLNFTSSVTKVTACVSSVQAGGQIQLRLGSPSGALIGTIAVPDTGMWSKYTTLSTTVAPTVGQQEVYFVFKGRNAVANLMWFKFS